MQGRLFDVCPECHERRNIRRGKTAYTDREYCSCPSCGHLWDPKQKGETSGEARKEEEEGEPVEGEGTDLEKAVEWALGGRPECHHGQTGFLVRVVRSGNGSIKTFKGRGRTRRAALVQAYRSSIAGGDD